MARIPRIVPPLALMALIFFLSAQPDLSSGLGTIDLIGRKLIHMTEYGLLWFLWARALGPERPLLAAVIAVAYTAPTSTTRPSWTAATARPRTCSSTPPASRSRGG